MEEIFENPILDDLFEIRTNGFESLFLKKYGKQENEKFLLAEKQVEMLLNQSVEDENVRQKIFEQYEKIMMEERKYWNNVYYKLGLVDGIKFVKEVKRMYEI